VTSDMRSSSVHFRPNVGLMILSFPADARLHNADYFRACPYRRNGQPREQCDLNCCCSLKLQPHSGIVRPEPSSVRDECESAS
jgi:hypothetical protein